MRRGRLLAGTLGLAALLAGLAVSSGAVGGLLPTPALVSLLGNDYFLAAGLGVLALLLAIPVLVSGRAANVSHATMPDPEEPARLPPPGDAFDGEVGAWTSHLPLVGHGRHRAVRDRLREAAIGVVARSEPCSRETAKGMVDRDRWTDDRVAADFLADSTWVAPSVGVRLGGVLRGEPWLERRADRTVEAIAAYDGRTREVTDGGRRHD